MLLNVRVPGKRIISFSEDLCELGRLVNCYDEPMGKCELLSVRGLAVSFSSVPCQASTVPFPMTPPYVGGASSFLSPFSTHVSRYAPGMPKPGVSKPTSPRPPALVHTVRLLTGYALQRPPVK